MKGNMHAATFSVQLLSATAQVAAAADLSAASKSLQCNIPVKAMYVIWAGQAAATSVATGTGTGIVFEMAAPAGMLHACVSPAVATIAAAAAAAPAAG
jgi:hypothetical protein